MDVEQTNSASLGRGFNIVLAVIVGVSLVGFAVGTRPSRGPEIAPASAASMRAEAQAVPSQAYKELRLRRYGANSELTSDLASLRGGLPKVTAAVTARSEAEHQRALAERARRRAYAGAPPTVPHPIDQKNVAACLACHEQGVVINGRVAPAMSHQRLTSCTQCHVAGAEQGDERPEAALEVANSFVGQGPPGKGSRAWNGAPPAIPHPTWMRQRCGSCHGVTGAAGLRTTHPERRSCAQCHSAEGFSPMPRQ